MREKLEQARELVRQAQSENAEMAQKDKANRDVLIAIDRTLYQVDKLLTGLLTPANPTMPLMATDRTLYQIQIDGRILRTTPKPNARLLALRDINKGGMSYKAGEEFEAHIRFFLCGLITCVLTNGAHALLNDEQWVDRDQLIDADVRVLADLT